MRALLRRVPDANVVALSRHPARLEQLQARLEGEDLERFVGVSADVGDQAGATAARRLVLREAGAYEVVIPSLGGWWEGRLLDVDDATYDRVMREMFRAHFAFARAFVPPLRERGAGLYLGIGGGAALYPVQNSSLVSIAGAAQLMLTRALAAETAGSGVTIRELVVNGPVNTRDSAEAAGPNWITADEIGEVVAELVATGATAWPNQRERGPLLIMDPLRS